MRNMNGTARPRAALTAKPADRREARLEARRVVRFARPVRAAVAPATVPPGLPPGRVINLPGRGEVFVRDSGGPPRWPAVLLLHGWTASADLNFFPVYAHLSDSYRVIALDLRGHGRGLRSVEPFRLEDCADDAAALLDELGTERVTVVGYSMGGPVGMLLARRHPGHVAALVMQATALEWRGTARERMFWRLLPVVEPGLRFGADAGLMERVLREAVEEAPELVAYRPWLAAEFRRGLGRDLGGAGRALGRYDARPWASQLGLPAVMLITTRDRLVRPSKQRELAAALGAQVLETDADHDLPLVNGAEYARLTRLAVDTAAELAGLVPSAGSGARATSRSGRFLGAARKALQGPHGRGHDLGEAGGRHGARRRDRQEPLDGNGLGVGVLEDSTLAVPATDT
jgi:3-oxoadipate enol-lactonase